MKPAEMTTVELLRRAATELDCAPVAAALRERADRLERAIARSGGVVGYAIEALNAPQIKPEEPGHE